VFAGQATRGWFDVHRIECARAQSPGVCTQSVMSTAHIRSDLIGRRQTDHGNRGHGDRILPTERAGHRQVNIWVILARKPCDIVPRYSFVLSNSCPAPDRKKKDSCQKKTQFVFPRLFKGHNEHDNVHSVLDATRIVEQHPCLLQLQYSF